MSLKKKSTNLCNYAWNIEFIRAWNVDGVCNPEWNDNEFKVIMVRAERRHWYGARVHGNLMVTRLQIQFRKELSPKSSSNNSSMIGIGNLSFTAFMAL